MGLYAKVTCVRPKLQLNTKTTVLKIKKEVQFLAPLFDILIVDFLLIINFDRKYVVTNFFDLLSAA